MNNNDLLNEQADIDKNTTIIKGANQADSSDIHVSDSHKYTKIKRLIGYTLFVLSCVCWCVIPILPFVGLSAVQIGSATAILLILAEVLFWLSIILLGKEFVVTVKAMFKRFLNSFVQRNNVDEDPP